MAAVTAAARPLAVLHMLTHARIDSGGAMQAFLLARELARRGHAVTMAFSERHGVPDADTRARVEAIGCAHAALPLRRVKGLLALRELLLRGRFDLVHLHREVALEQFLRVRRFLPPIAAIANVGTSKPPERAQRIRLNHREIDRVVVVAEALKRLLVAAAGVDPCRIATVEGAYDEQAFVPGAPHARPVPRAELGVPEGAPLVGVVANLDPKKGHRVFVDAAARVARARPDAYFVCAGKGDPSPLQEHAKNAGLPPERVRFLGFRRDVPALLATLTASVSASTRGEGMTGSIRESLAMGTPVVCTALAGNPEIVRHGETGLLVPVDDADALARAILDVLERPDQAKARAARGREAVARLTSARRAERMEALYREVVEWRAARSASVDSILYPDVAAN